MEQKVAKSDLLSVLHWLLRLSVLASNPETLGKNYLGLSLITVLTSANNKDTEAAYCDAFSWSEVLAVLTLLVPPIATCHYIIILPL